MPCRAPSAVGVVDRSEEFLSGREEERRVGSRLLVSSYDIQVFIRYSKAAQTTYSSLSRRVGSARRS
jgi:hypothetical protein